MPRRLPAARQLELQRRRRRARELEGTTDEDSIGTPIKPRKSHLSWNQLEAEIDKRMTMSTLKEANRGSARSQVSKLVTKQSYRAPPSKPAMQRSSSRGRRVQFDPKTQRTKKSNPSRAFDPKGIESPKARGSSTTLFKTQVVLPTEKANSLKQKTVVTNKKGDLKLKKVESQRGFPWRKQHDGGKTRQHLKKTSLAVQNAWLREVKEAIWEAIRNNESTETEEHLSLESDSDVFTDPESVTSELSDDFPHTDTRIQLFGTRDLATIDDGNDDGSVGSIELLFNWLTCHKSDYIRHDKMRRFDPRGMVIKPKVQPKRRRSSRPRTMTL